MARVLITGGGSGIGRALTCELVGRGNTVLACGRQESRLAELEKACPGVKVLACDVASHEGRERLVERVRSTLGALDVLINNAGVQQTQAYGTGTIDHAKLTKEIEINLIAPMVLSDMLIPLLRQSARPTIVNVVSLLAVIPKPSTPGYCASKAGLLAFTRSLRQQVAGSNFKIVDLFPPLVDTPMTAGRGREKMSAGQFARDVADALESSRDHIAVGDAARLLRLSRWMPALAEKALKDMIRPDVPIGTQ